MSFFSINQMVHQSGHSLQRWEFLPLRVFVSLCLSKKIPLYSHMWAKDVKAALQMSAFIRFSALTRKKSLRPISFVKGLLQDETCPRPGLFFFFFFSSQGHMSSCCLAACLDQEEEELQAFIRCITSPRANQLLKCWLGECWDDETFIFTCFSSGCLCANQLPC